MNKLSAAKALEWFRNGFDTYEIAHMLQTTEATVYNAIHVQRRINTGKDHALVRLSNATTEGISRSGNPHTKRLQRPSAIGN